MKQIHIATYQERSKKLAEILPDFGKPVVIRLGGTMGYSGYPVQINTAEAVKNSINKLNQKLILVNAGLFTQPLANIAEAKYPLVCKGVVRSCGTSVKVVNNLEELKSFVKSKKWEPYQYYIEPFFEQTSEYRLHCTQKEVFFAVKKIKRNEADNIITSKNHYNVRDFVKPRLWEEIKKQCVEAAKATGLDICAVDVGYSSKGDKHTFVIHEINTNPELLENTLQKYKEALTNLINQKIK